MSVGKVAAQAELSIMCRSRVLNSLCRAGGPCGTSLCDPLCARSSHLTLWLELRGRLHVRTGLDHELCMNCTGWHELDATICKSFRRNTTTPATDSLNPNVAHLQVEGSQRLGRAGAPHHRVVGVVACGSMPEVRDVLA